MKKTIGIMGVILLSFLAVTVNAQQTEPEQKWDPKKNPTVDAITSPYKDKMIAPRPALTTVDIFPALGKYESSVNADAASVTITLDEQNKGLVWIEGLPQGKINAMLRKSPATYKIPAQKTADGKDVPEGTLIFDRDTKTLSIAIGKEFNSADPATAFVQVTEDPAPVVIDKKDKGKMAKIKKETQPKTWIYTGTKVENASAMN